MSILTRKKTPLKMPNWLLWIGLFGIVNFLAGCWFLFPPNKGKMVYFWFVEFYDSMLLPSLIFFPISMIIVVLWFSCFVQKFWVNVVILMVGTVISALCFMPAFGTAVFISNLSVIGNVKQNEHYYYLVMHYDDQAPYYSFCESDIIGFAGQCRYIGWKGEDTSTEIYINPSTNLITVESANPSFIWTNSIPPSCMNNIDESDEYVGGCTP